MFSRSLCFQGHSGMWRAFSIVMCPMFLLTLTYTNFPPVVGCRVALATLSAYNSFVSSVVLALSFLSLTQDGSDTGCPLEGGGWAPGRVGPQFLRLDRMFSTDTTRSQSMFDHFASYPRLRSNSNNNEWNTILNMLPVDVVRVLLLSDNPVDE